jgi:hypothetical protein
MWTVIPAPRVVAVSECLEGPGDDRDDRVILLNVERGPCQL